MDNFIDGGGVPLGFGMALAQNSAAMDRFAGLGEPRRRALLDGARALRSREEMRDYVSRIAEGRI